MKNLNIIVLSGIATTLLFAGCEKAPQGEIDKAKQAVTAAAADASVYAADKLAAARSALDSALAAVKKEDSKFIKNFTVAKAKLAAAAKAAEDATAAAVEKKEALKIEATALVGQAKNALDDARKAMRKTKKKSTKAIKAAFSDAEKAVAAAETAITGNDFAGAKSSAEAALEKANKVKSDLKPAKKQGKISKKK